jgi:translocation protein SEC63
MSSGETVYDESGALASYFGISFLSLVLFPTTLVLLKRSVTSGPKKGKECSCADCQKKIKALKAGERGLNLFSIRWVHEGHERSVTTTELIIYDSFRNLLLLAGWAAFFALAYTISQEEPGSLKIYDPFEILGISSVSEVVR